MVAHFKIELEDLIAAQRDAVDTVNFHKRNKLIVSIVTVILFMLYISMTIFKTYYILNILVAIALFFFINNFIYKQAMISQAKRLAKNNPSLLAGDCILTISEKGLLREFNNATQNFEWNQIKLAKEDEERYILYISDIQTTVVKKNPYNLSEEDILKYNEMICSYLCQAGLEIKKCRK